MSGFGKNLGVKTQDYTLLVVDDNPTNLGVIVSHLEDSGFQVVVSQDGKSGLERAECVKPDLILLDIIMPGMSGFEVCRSLKENEKTREIPVIFMTALHEVEDKIKGFEVGGVDYVTKPIQIEEVLPRIKLHLELKAIQKQLETKNDLLQKEIEERKKAEEQLKDSNKELEAFSYSVSHDLRAPIRHISGFVNLLEEHLLTSLKDQDRHYLKTIEESAARMGTLVDDLLAFSKIGRTALNHKQVDLRAIVQEAKKDLSEEIKERKIIWDIGSLPQVNGDPSMLRIVFVNLIANAIKYTRPRSEARIEIKSMDNGPRQVTVFVRDNGVGFDMRYVHKLFGVFQRLHRSEEFEGAGIGLANVSRIIGRHGGKVWAESVLDKGATFYFSLPKKKKN